MAGLIQATPDQLRSYGSQYQSDSGEVADVIARCDSRTLEMLETWKGSASEAFNQQYEELKPSIRKFIELLDDIGRQVQSVANILESTDADIASQING